MTWLFVIAVVIILLVGWSVLAMAAEEDEWYEQHEGQRRS